MYLYYTYACIEGETLITQTQACIQVEQGDKHKRVFSKQLTKPGHCDGQTQTLGHKQKHQNSWLTEVHPTRLDVAQINLNLARPGLFRPNHFYPALADQPNTQQTLNRNAKQETQHGVPQTPPRSDLSVNPRQTQMQTPKTVPNRHKRYLTPERCSGTSMI